MAAALLQQKINLICKRRLENGALPQTIPVRVKEEGTKGRGRAMCVELSGFGAPAPPLPPLNGASEYNINRLRDLPSKPHTLTPTPLSL